jgi:hypothetical protein
MSMDLAVWRDVSLLWLIFLTLITVLPFAVLFFYAIKGLHRLRQLAKQYLPIAQEKARMVAGKTEEISQQIAGPIIAIQSKSAQANSITKAIFTRRKSA